MGLFSSPFDSLGPTLSLLGEATSEFLPAAQEDLARNLEICDLIRSKQIPSRNAMRAIKERLLNRNPNVQLLALSLTDCAVKNAGGQFLREIASREFVDSITELCKQGNSVVSTKARELFQSWSVLLGRSDSSLQYMMEAYEQMKREGMTFPSPPTQWDFKLNPEKLLATETPPEWSDSVNCMRCNVPFSMLLRKHHCRKCGKTFCQPCSSKTMALPELALYEEVRVCEICYSKKLSERRNSEHRRRTSSSSQSSAVIKNDDEDDIAKAIRQSLQETGPQSVVDERSNSYDEEAALAAAIAASLEATKVKLPFDIPAPAPTNIQPASLLPIPVEEAEDSPVITPIERENVHLFAELVSRLNGEEPKDDQFKQLALQMAELTERLQGTPSDHMDVSRIVAILKEALGRYESLGSDASLKAADFSVVPTRPRSRTGSIIGIEAEQPKRTSSSPEASIPSFAVPPPAKVVPVLKPKPLRPDKSNDLIPNLHDENEPSASDGACKEPREDPLAELLEDAPLIQL